MSTTRTIMILWELGGSQGRALRLGLDHGKRIPVVWAASRPSRMCRAVCARKTECDEATTQKYKSDGGLAFFKVAIPSLHNSPVADSMACNPVDNYEWQRYTHFLQVVAK